MNTVYVSSYKLKKIVKMIFQSEGVISTEADILARHLVLANLRGVDTHGVSRVKTYVKRLRTGNVNKNTQYEILKETPSSYLIDGKNSLGIVLASEGIRLAVDKANKSGACVVSIRNSNHCGMLADYVKYAATNNCIAIAVTNAPPAMPPWGGKESFFGTNPIAYGIPTGNDNPIIFDMATSVVARGKIRQAQKNNVSIPTGWAITKEGRDTNDPNEALNGGSILPVGDHKGYGLALFVEVLSGILSGSGFGPHLGSLYENEKQNLGHLFLVFKVNMISDIDAFVYKINQMIQEIKGTPLAEGFEKIYIPGEIENAIEEKRRKEGIPLDKDVYVELVNLLNS